MMIRTITAVLLLCASSASFSAIDCQKIGEVCVAPNETRMIDGMSVTRDCWEYQDTYECLSSTLTEDTRCQELRAQGCSQIGSACVSDSANGCMTYEQTYECPSGQPPAQQAVLDCGGQLYCMDGNCFDTSYKPNSNFGKVGALLSVMQSISEELSMDTVEVFKGQDKRCGVSITDAIGAQNCCKVDGWAEGVFNCSFDEKLLADLGKASRCHHVGTYCSYKTVLGICTMKKQTYCCFNSKLSRIISEQARPQLGKGWGDSKNPDCSGFTMQEIATLDFEAMDLSEFYADVMASMPTINAGDLQNRLTDRLNTLMP